jgi:hypothetical protein
LKRPSMKWLETAFAEDVGGALLAFRAGRHRAYLAELDCPRLGREGRRSPLAGGAEAVPFFPV